MATIPKQVKHYRRRRWLAAIFNCPENPKPHFFNPRQRRWIPDNKLTFIEAVDVYGKINIPSWTHEDLSVTYMPDPPDPPWLWRQFEHDTKDDKFICFNDKDEITRKPKAEAQEWWSQIEPVLIKEWEQNTEAASRFRACIDGFRSQLSNETCTAEILTDSGHYVRIPAEFWLANNAISKVVSGKTSIRDIYETMRFEGVILFDDDFLTPQPLNSLSEVNAVSVDQTFHNLPYLTFMIAAAQALDLDAGKRHPKKQIEAWLKENWPEELGEPSQSKLANMASFLRRPEDEKGGLF